MSISQQELGNFLYNKIFIETGTNEGGSVRSAVKAGFERIYSIELDKEKHAKNQKRFKNVQQVELLQGDSGVVLENIMMRLNDPTTFWLDSHLGEDNTYCPLIEELKIIRRHKIKTHTILIDDRRLFKKGWCGIHEKDILLQLRMINQSYKIRYIDGYSPDDIIVAEKKEIN